MPSRLVAIATLVLLASITSASTPTTLSNLDSVFGAGHKKHGPGHRCKSGHLNHTRVYDTPEEDLDHPARSNATHRRAMQEQADATYEPIRILVNTGNIDSSTRICTRAGQWRTTFGDGNKKCKTSQILTSALKTKLMTGVNAAVATIEDLLSVVPLSRMPRYRGGCDSKLLVPYSYKSTSTAPTGADFVIFISAGIEPSEGTMAWALWCHVASSANPRPAYGHFNMNVEVLAEISAREVYLTAVHEIYHALGWESYYMTHHMASDLKTYTIRGRSAKVLAGTNMKREVQRYFGCSTAKGAELEEGGGSGTVGSHLEARTFKMEVMAGEGDDTYISRISLAFFADTGVYQVDWANAEAMYWGKDMGCGFVNEKCDHTSAGKGQYWYFPEVTDASATYTVQWNCDWDRRFIGRTIVQKYSQPLPSAMRYYPSNSRLGGYTEVLDYCPAVISTDRSGTMCSDMPPTPSPPTPATPTPSTGCKVFFSGLCPGNSLCRCTLNQACGSSSLEAFNTSHHAMLAQGTCTGQCKTVQTGQCSGDSSCVMDTGVTCGGTTARTAAIQETTPTSTTASTGEGFGPTSRCWPTSGIGNGDRWAQGDGNPRCYQKKCVSGRLKVKIGSSWVTCPTAGGSVSAPSGFSGSITCPPTDVYCPTCVVTFAGSSQSLGNSLINYILKKINTARMAQWDYAKSLPLVKWNPNLATMADSYLRPCPALRYQSSSSRRNKYGFRYVGQMMTGGSSSSNRYFSNSINVYLNRAQYYSVASNSCSRSGTYCDKYIQLINKNSLEVGCGYKYCRNPTRRMWLCNFGEGYYHGKRPFTLGEPETDTCQYQ